jgi:hypothetical protein
MMLSKTFEFWLYPAPDQFQRCFIQAGTKAHADKLVREKLKVSVHNLHAFSCRRDIQLNWPNGTLVVGKVKKELF